HAWLRPIDRVFASRGLRAGAVRCGPDRAARRAGRGAGHLGRPRLGEPGGVGPGKPSSRAMLRRGQPLRAVPGAGLCSPDPHPSRRPLPLSRRAIPRGAVGVSALLRGELRQGAGRLRGQRLQHRQGPVQKGKRERQGKPSRTAHVRRDGGWFGGKGQAPEVPMDTDVLTPADFDTYVAALERNGFFGPDSWYMNSARNLEFARQAVHGGVLSLPVLFLPGEYDYTYQTVVFRLA